MNDTARGRAELARTGPSPWSKDVGGLSRQVIKQGIAEIWRAFGHRLLTGDPQGGTTWEAGLACVMQGPVLAVQG